MEQTDFDGIVFADTLQDFNNLRYAGHIVHILCCGGNMGFTFQDTRYNIAVGDYVILPNGELGSEYNPQNEMFQRFKTKCSFLQNEAYLCKSFFLP